MFRAVVFDFDGTLVTGTHDGYVRCYHAAAESQGYRLPITITKQRVLEQWGQAPRIELESVLRETPALADKALEVYEKLILTELFSAEVCPIPGASDALAELREMQVLPVVISGMPKRLLELFAMRFKFDFRANELISTIDTDNPSKQKNTGFQLANEMAFRGWLPHELIVVCDRND